MTPLEEKIKEFCKRVMEGEVDIPTIDGTSTTASAEDQAKAKKYTQAGTSVKFVKKGELEEGAVPQEEAEEKLTSMFGKLQEAEGEIAEIEDFFSHGENAKAKKLSAKLAQIIKEAVGIISEMRQLKEGVIAEEKEKASLFGDKVIKAMGKHVKDDEAAKRAKKKYMKYIEAAYAHSKTPKEVAERIVDHRFEF